MGIPTDLTTTPADKLYDMLFDLAEYRRTDGRGRNECAQYVREYVSEESKRVKTELKRRKLPTRRTVVETAPGQEWQANFNFG